MSVSEVIEIKRAPASPPPPEAGPQAMPEPVSPTMPARMPDPMAGVREMVRACIQCGTCTGSCPNAFAMDMTPRAMWRTVLAGGAEDIFRSKTFVLCSACYCCTLRCPRGLPLTDAMAALKQLAERQGRQEHPGSRLFYKKFMESIRRNGRINEMGFMTAYFVALKNPITPMKFTPLGMKLMAKHKIAVALPARGPARLAGMFRKAAELEEAR
jgi:heterodisulfide reductase subunit C